jgi:tetratricopeptide (TPR) repeat protein
MDSIRPQNRFMAALLGYPLLAAFSLFGVGFWLATRLHAPLEQMQNSRLNSDDPLTALLGEGRKLFANHFYVKADVYFHSGFYPTIFDNRESHQTPHLAEDAGVTRSKNSGDEDTFLGQPSDWIDAHSRRHFPTRHTHLGEDAPGELSGGSEREIMPWLKLSSKLDPNLIESYTVAAYWLRRIGKAAEAECFLRDGLRANPGCAEIIFELGRCRFDGKDAGRARNLWELAWRRWNEQESSKPAEERNHFLASQILLSLAVLESREGNRDRCLHWLEILLPLKPNPDDIRKRIAEVKFGLPLTAADPQPAPAAAPASKP